MNTKNLNDPVALIANFLAEARSSGLDHFVTKGALANPNDFLSLQDFQNMLNNPLLTPEWVQVKLSGKYYNFEGDLLCKAVQQHQLRFIDKTRLNELIEKGASVVLEGIDLQDPRINAVCAALERQYPCVLSNCVGFFSQLGSEAYAGHKDSDDVVVAQLSGQKKWRIYKRQSRQFVGSFPMSEEQMAPLVCEVVLEPGDIMFVRSSTPHRVETVGSHSLHLAFDLWDKTPSMTELMERALESYKLEPAAAYSPVGEVASAISRAVVQVGASDAVSQMAIQRAADARLFRLRTGNTRSLTAFNKWK